MESLVIAIIFAPLSWLYRLGTGVHRALTRTHRLPFPVVSVGNIAMGGRAKTPFVIYLCHKLKAAGYRPVVLTRGYSRAGTASHRWLVGEKTDAVLMGDEATEIARSGAAVAILIGAKRAKNAESFLSEQRQINRWVFVLDDGFQHWALERDVDIALVTDHDLVNHVVPWGELRETPASLSRASLVLRLGQDIVKETVVDQSASVQKPLVLTTRANAHTYLQEMKKRFFGAELVSLRDHAGRDNLVQAITKFRGTDVILGDKEAVKLFDDNEYREWRQRGVVTKRLVNADKKIYRAYLRLVWNNERAALQTITQKISQTPTSQTKGES